MDVTLVLGRLVEGCLCGRRDADEREGRGGGKGFGERAKGRKVEVRRGGRRQEVGVRGAWRGSGRRQDWDVPV